MKTRHILAILTGVLMVMSACCSSRTKTSTDVESSRRAEGITANPHRKADQNVQSQTTTNLRYNDKQ